MLLASICFLGLDAARSRRFGAGLDLFGVEMLLACVLLEFASIIVFWSIGCRTL
jgi:hypothetical protein